MRLSLSSVVLCSLLVIDGRVTNAAVLEVGVGQTYTTLQAAYNASGAGDTIRVHGGTYGSGGVVLDGRAGLGFGDTHTDRSGLVIEAYGDGRVFLDGGINFFGTADGNIGDITVRDMFITPDDGGVGIWLRSDSPGALKGVTLTNNVIFGSDLSSGIYVYGTGTHGQHTIEHNTVFGGKGGANTSIAFRDSANSSVMPVPIWRSNMAVGADLGFSVGLAGSGSTGVGPDGRFSYSNFFDNTTDFDNGNPVVKGPSNVFVDPVFASLNPGDADFLNLSLGSPASVLTGAHDGTFRGALGIVPEPASLMMVGVGLGLMLKRSPRRG